MEAARAATAFFSIYRAQLAVGFALFAATLLGSLAAAAYILVKMPPDYLQSPENVPFWPGRPAWQRTMARVGKNLLGVVLVATGIVLSLPGVPGQGILTVLIGVMLLDFPGKRRVERRIIGYPRVLSSVNRLRARFGRAPLEVGAPSGVPS